MLPSLLLYYVFLFIYYYFFFILCYFIFFSLSRILLCYLSNIVVCIQLTNKNVKKKYINYKWVLRLQRVDESKMSSGISPPDVGDLSRHFEGAIASLVKGGDSISDQSMRARQTNHKNEDSNPQLRETKWALNPPGYSSKSKRVLFAEYIMPS